MRWRTPRDEQLGKRRQHVFVFQVTCDGQRQALPAGLVDDREDPELAPVVRSRFDKVVRPDMPRILRPQPDARAVVQPQPATLGLLLWHLQPLTPPDAFDTLMIH